MQFVLHYGGHFVVPVLIALTFFRENWKRAALLLLLTNLVDLDHFLADPIFAEDRCSIQYHWLHTYGFILIYLLLVFSKGWLRIIGLGLCLHMFFDLVDCLFMYDQCQACLEDAPALPLLTWLSTIIE